MGFRPALFYASLILFAASNYMIIDAGHLGNGGLYFTIYWMASLIAGIGIWHNFPVLKPVRTILFIIGIALLVRIPYILFFAEGDDLYRYLWEGMIQNHGFSPYLYAPDSPCLAYLRNDSWNGVNHKSIPAIYPPLSQLIFRVLDLFNNSPVFFKAFFALCDVATAGILILWSKTKSYELRHVLFFALSPVSIIFSAGEGHLDAVMVTALAGAFYFYDTGKFKLAFLFLGCAVMFKIIPFILIPFFITRKNIRWVWITALPALSMFLFEGSFIDVLIQYAGYWWYNGPIVWIFIKTIGVYFTGPAAGAVFVVFALREFIFGADRIRSMQIVIGIFFLTSTAIHPWYLLWGVVLIPFYRSPTFITYCAMIAVTFSVNDISRRTGIWTISDTTLIIEYVPVVIVFLYMVFLRCSPGRKIYETPTSIAVIIPAFQEEKNIKSCISAILEQSRIPDKIIVADGGSTDKTIFISKSFPSVEVISTNPGRGIQIKAAVDICDADVILVCHADVILHNTMIEEAIGVLIKKNTVAGGAFKVSYDVRSFTAFLISWINAMKTFFLGISFGDQCQFFRRAALTEGFPGIRLMEDVELSFRIREAGGFKFFLTGPNVSFRRWESKGLVSNFYMIVLLTLSYCILRRFGMFPGDGTVFYNRYYSNK